MSARPAFTVSGRGEDRTSPEAGPALSLAITLASRLTEEGSVYVRDADGHVVGRATREADGVITIHRNGGSK